MDISKFKGLLKNHSKSFGGTFTKADFHLHAPKSSDYEYKGDDATDQLATAINSAGYGIVTIVMHDQFPPPSTLDELYRLCPRTKFIPGAEINVFVDTLYKKVSKDHYFHCIVAADPDESREYAYVLEKARDDLSYRSDTSAPGFHSSIEDVAKCFVDQGALFIPAHLHQCKSPETSRSIDDIYDDDSFLGFVERSLFSAVEVREKSTASFFDGKQQTTDGRSIPEITCVQSSDAHSHQHVVERNRATWVQVEEKTFSELAAALSFEHRVALVEPESSHGQILGLHISGSFFADEWIAFNPGMNCFIGCKGSGKTAVLECLRFILNVSVPSERKESVDKHCAFILGSSGLVECLVRTVSGRELLLVRRADSPDRLVVIDEAGVSREVRTAKDAGFDASILGWHEIEGVADHAAARIRLVDQIENPKEIEELAAKIDRTVELAKDVLPAFQRKVHRLNGILKEWWELKNKREALKRLEDEQLFDLQKKYESYVAAEQRLGNLGDEIVKSAGDLGTTAANKFESLQEGLKLPDGATADLQEVMERVVGQVDGVMKAVQESTSKITRLSEEASENIGTNRDAVAKSFVEFRENTYEPTVADLQPEEREILSRQIQTIEQTKDLPEVERNCRQLQREVSDLAANLHSYCNDVCEARERICQIRSIRIDEVNEADGPIRLRFLRSANRSRQDRFQKTFGEEGQEVVSFLGSYGGQESYEKLKKLFESFMTLKIDEDAWSVRDILWDVKFVDFLKVVDDDDVEIALVVGDAGPTPIQNLSAGQRCTAVFPLLLQNTRAPLVIDQPEDNLDNRYIAEVIAPELLKRKLQQQLILTSHNANLVVLTDSDLIAHVDSDGRKGKTETRGFLSCGRSRIRPAVVEVLDGGEAALEARQRKYQQR